MSSRFGTRTVMSCMRNEALFLVEWVAFYRALGFDHLVIITNDCTDGTDLILDRMQEMGLVTHVRNNAYGADGPQIHGLRMVREELPIVGRADWLLHVDSDEFLNIFHGDHTIDALIDVVQGFDTCALAWRAFGDNGHKIWPGGNVIENFTMSDKKPIWATAFHKALMQPRKFQRFNVHMPKHPVNGAVTQCNAMGQQVETSALFNLAHDRHRNMDRAMLTWDGACINHYAIRSEDLFLMKNDRGDSMLRSHSKYMKNSTYYRRYNTNKRPETSILRHMPEMAQAMEEMRADPLLSALEHASALWWDNRRESVLTPERIAAWTLPEEDQDSKAKVA